jgi:PIN domain nuclease of toxin-antitoxin system
LRLLVVHRRSYVVIDGSHCHRGHPNEKYVSAIAAWGFIAKFQSSKEPGISLIAADVSGAVAAQGLTQLPITMRHAEVAVSLPLDHKDPMDRLLIAQAIVEASLTRPNTGRNARRHPHATSAG